METVILTIGVISSVYSLLIYVLPPNYAKKLKPIGVILNMLANTPGGLKFK